MIGIAGVLIFNGSSSAGATPMSKHSMTAKYIYRGGACAPLKIDTYPRYLCKRPIDTVVDSFGYKNRQCGSYAAWLEQSTGHYMPYHLSNTVGGWPTAVPTSWVVTQPEAGDIAIRPSVPGLVLPDGKPDPGHAMYIVNPDYHRTGNLLVKEYNNGYDTGDFNIAVVRRTFNFYGHHLSLVYIQFPPMVTS